MKTFSCSLLATALTVLSWLPAQGQTPTPQVIPPATAAPAPTGEVPAIAPSPGGTSVVGTVGLAIYNNAVYLVHDNSVTRVDAATIPSGHMMTLDGRIVPLPAGVQFPQLTAPNAGTGPAGGAVQSNLR